MRFLKQRLAMSAVFGVAFVVLMIITVHGCIRNLDSLSHAPYVEEYADWYRYLFPVLLTAVAAIELLVMPWPARFSLRALFIVTTLVAIVLGIMAIFLR
jgi:hypothetical protein